MKELFQKGKNMDTKMKQIRTNNLNQNQRKGSMTNVVARAELAEEWSKKFSELEKEYWKRKFEEE